MGFDVQGLASEWDQIESIRERLRGGKTLGVLPKGVTIKTDATIAEAVANSDVLIPCLHRLLPAQLKLPEINPLRDVIQEAYTLNQRDVTIDVIDDDSWQLKKLIRFVKRKAKRGDPSTAS